MQTCRVISEGEGKEEAKYHVCTRSSTGGQLPPPPPPLRFRRPRAGMYTYTPEEGIFHAIKRLHTGLIH